MIVCTNCGTNNLASSQFCDECGTKLIKFDSSAAAPAVYVPPGKATHTVVQPEPLVAQDRTSNGSQSQVANGSLDATLTIERGGNSGSEFSLRGAEAIVGRWDADNGVFPEVDLDTHDQEAKVSRRHARIKILDGRYVVEDLGSTNGTYINRGRRLLPGTPQPIGDGDELIVGKTFLRFRINTD